MKQGTAAVLRHIIDSLIVTVFASVIVVAAWSIAQTWCEKVFAWIAEVGFGYVVIAVGGGSAVLGWAFPRGVIASCRGLKLWPKHWGLVIRGFAGFVLAVILGKLTGLLEVEAWGVWLLLLEGIVFLFLVLCGAAIFALMHSKLVDGIRGGEEHTVTNDRPIRRVEDDEFDHKDTAGRVFDLLRSGAGDRGPNVAVVGRFGSGKTSLCYLIEDICKKSGGSDAGRFEFCRFEAWPHLNAEGAARDLLDRIVSKVSELVDCSGLGRLPDEYVEVLGVVPGNWIAALSAILRKRRSLEDIVQSLQDVLLRIDKRVVVFVDDFDRLEKRSEDSQQAVAAALNQLQNLTNVQYVLCVGPMGEGPGADLLKLTRFQELMPEVGGEEVIGAIRVLRDQALRDDQEMYYPFDLNKEESNDPFMYYFHREQIASTLVSQLVNLIETPRQLKAVEREVDQRWKGGLRGEICWYDLLLMSALKVGEPRVFEWIMREPGIFLGEMSDRKERTEEGKAEVKQAIDKQLRELVEVSTKVRLEVVGRILGDLFPQFVKKLGDLSEYLTGKELVEWEQRIAFGSLRGKSYLRRYFSGRVETRDTYDQPTLQFIRNCSSRSFEKHRFEELYLGSYEKQTKDINTFVQFSGLLSEELAIEVCDCMLDWFCDREHWAAWDSTDHYVSRMMSHVTLIVEKANRFESGQRHRRGNREVGLEKIKDEWAKQRVVELVLRDVIVGILFAKDVCKSVLGEVETNGILGKAVREEFLGNTEAIWEGIKGDRVHLYWVLDALKNGEAYGGIRVDVTERVVERLNNECAVEFAESVIISLVHYLFPSGQPDRVEGYEFSVKKDENEKTYDMDVLLPVVAGLRGRELEDAVARKAFDVLMKAYSEELKGLEGESGGDSQEEGDVTC